jgi:hypothetical protein
VNTTAHTAKATQIHTAAKCRIAGMPFTSATAKLQTAYMRSGNTVDQRRTS